MANGYAGKLLWVDLKKQTCKEEAIDERLGRMYLGGYGLGARILYNRMKAGVDPLGPEAILGILTGPATGTPFIGGSRYVVVGKSPLTGGWGDANSGGWFGPYMKFAGYDGVFFTDISDKPVYLFIDNGKAEIRDAAILWGKDTFETEEILKTELGKDTQIACIGPSGEKLSLIAAVMNNKGRAAARSGLGAVMGSKRVKAVAVRGKPGSIPVADKKKAAFCRKTYLPHLTGHADILREFGTPGIMVPMAMAGDSPVKNWMSSAALDFPDVELISGNKTLENQEKRYACYQCPIGCGGHMKASDGEYKYTADAHKPEYETLAMFGSNCLNYNLNSIIKINDICNRAGLDTISTGSAIGFTIDCYESGLITSQDTGGLKMNWGNHQAMVAMTEKIARREGFGNILADGIKKASEKIGRKAERLAMHIGGQEYPAHDAKFGFHWAIGYRVDATPGRHTQGPGMGPKIPLPEVDPRSQSGRQPAHVLGANAVHYVQALGLCTFVCAGLPDLKSFQEMVKAVMGWDVTAEEITRTGERIADMRHVFNLREGISPLVYHHPDRMAGRPPRTAGPLAGITLDEERMLEEFFEAMDWELTTARPSKKKLLELGMDDIASELWS
ncbi:MAG: aldehyde ferredoxin oxidoreductase family protein [Dehalococcoidales bacterium]|nr:aldehyde ferredoxin oxidoreductase family protein [Dehalococcoidales bacterium]